MTFHWQDLQDDGRKRYWWHGRCWLRGAYRDDHRHRPLCLRLEWCLPSRLFGLGVTIGDGDSGADLSAQFTIPFLVTLYITLEHALPTYVVGYSADEGHDREIGISIHEWVFRYRLWVGSMSSWTRTAPWCRWWRQGHVDLKDVVLGRTTYRSEQLGPMVPVTIPMPEGDYRAEATIERQTWTRPRWRAWSRTSVHVQVPRGLPFAGKGENSWDCGDDGLFGYGCEGTIDDAIIRGIEIVLENRRRYGRASADAVREALAG